MTRRDYSKKQNRIVDAVVGIYQDRGIWWQIELGKASHELLDELPGLVEREGMSWIMSVNVDGAVRIIVRCAEDPGRYVLYRQRRVI